MYPGPTVVQATNAGQRAPPALGRCRWGVSVGLGVGPIGERGRHGATPTIRTPSGPSSTGLRNVRADPGQVEQVVTNLEVNARDAMPRGGELTLETESVVLGDDFATSHHGVHPGDCVMLDAL